jgi:hypothetical protein
MESAHCCYRYNYYLVYAANILLYNFLAICSIDSVFRKSNYAELEADKGYLLDGCTQKIIEETISKTILNSVLL